MAESRRGPRREGRKPGRDRNRQGDGRIAGAGQRPNRQAAEAQRRHGGGRRSDRLYGRVGARPRPPRGGRGRPGTGGRHDSHARPSGRPKVSKAVRGRRRSAQARGRRPRAGAAASDDKKPAPRGDDAEAGGQAGASAPDDRPWAGRQPGSAAAGQAGASARATRSTRRRFRCRFRPPGTARARKKRCR